MVAWFKIGKRNDELSFAHLQSFQRNWYRAEKIIFGFLCLLVIAAGCGFLGDDKRGTYVILSNDQTLKLSFSHFGRFSALSKLGIDEIALPTEASIDVLIDKALLSSIEIEKVTPRPISITVDADGILYKFDAKQNFGGHIEFSVRNQKIGSGYGSIALQSVNYPIHRIILP